MKRKPISPCSGARDYIKFTILSYAISTLFVFSSSIAVWAEDPETEKIAFVSKRDGNAEIYIMNPDGSEQTNLTQHPAEDYDPAWAPGGKQILFSSNRDGPFDLYLMDADGKNLQKVFKSSKYRRGPTWSPDGKRIAYAQANPQKAILLFGARFVPSTELTLYIATPTGHTAEKLTDGFDPSWSPNGREIVYVMGGRKQTPLGIFDLQTRTRDILLPRDIPWILDPTWSPQGDKIIFTKLNGAGFNAQGFLTFQKGTLHTVNLDDMGLEQITDELSSYNPTWSPQSKEIIYNARSGTLQLYKMKLDVGTSTQLTHDGSNSSPDWLNPNTLKVSPSVHSLTTIWGKIKTD